MTPKGSAVHLPPYIILVISIGIFLSSLFYLSYELIQPAAGTIVLPGGKTYLGNN